MQILSSEPTARVVVLATGGTIAGTASAATDSVGYAAARLGVAQRPAAVPALAGLPLDAEQVAQVDSKDMDVAVWQALVRRAAHHLQRPEVAGLVVTHGTDTLEESAYLLQRLLAPTKPVVMTAAMRPATSLQADGPQNLLDAVTLAGMPGARGVLVVLAGRVHAGTEVRKRHTHDLDAFGSGDAGPLARIEAGGLRQFRDWPGGTPLGAEMAEAARWPRVEIVLSHAGASGALVDALVNQGVEGIVAAGTGNATLHHALEAALRRAQDRGVAVRRCSRVGAGAVLAAPGAGDLPHCGALTPVQARVELMLELLASRRG